MNAPELILHNGKITTLDAAQPQVFAIARSPGGTLLSIYLLMH